MMPLRSKSDASRTEQGEVANMLACAGPLWRRAVAGILDLAVLGIPGSVAGWMIWHRWWSVALENFQSSKHTDTGGMAPIIILVMILTGPLAVLAGLLPVGLPYFALFECSRLRGTPGKLLLGLKVTDEQGRNLSISRAMMRILGKMALFGASTLVGVIMAQFFWPLAVIGPWLVAVVLGYSASRSTLCQTPYDRWSRSMVQRRDRLN